jgi:hypothetical protein
MHQYCPPSPIRSPSPPGSVVGKTPKTLRQRRRSHPHPKPCWRNLAQVAQVAQLLNTQATGYVFILHAMYANLRYFSGCVSYFTGQGTPSTTLGPTSRCWRLFRHGWLLHPLHLEVCLRSKPFLIQKYRRLDQLQPQNQVRPLRDHQ